MTNRNDTAGCFSIRSESDMTKMTFKPRYAKAQTVDDWISNLNDHASFIRHEIIPVRWFNCRHPISGERMADAGRC